MLSQIKSLIPTPVKHLLKNFVPGLHSLKPRQPVVTPEQWEMWRERGYLVLPKFFDAKLLNQVSGVVDEFWATRKTPKNPLVIDIFIGTPNEKRIYFRDAPDEARNFSYKLNDLFLESALIQETITSPLLCRILGDLLDGDPLVCNSLTFERSSQQGFHFDTFYMPPPVENKMLASWIALEDAHENAGPLEYYPGSHKIPPYRFSDGRLNQAVSEMDSFNKYIHSEIERRNLKTEIFPAKAGDVFIWHAQLYHAGRPIKDMSLTRKSLVTHYFRAVDFPAVHCRKIGHGRYYLNREHQKVKSS